MITSAFLVGRDRYERAMEGWVDNTHDDAFTHTVAISDDDRSIELSAVYTPPPGARKIFVRKKRSRLVLTARRLHLFHSMHDNVHGFDLHYEVDLDSGTIVAADSITSRLPYQGICTEPQRKVAAMIGQP